MPQEMERVRPVWRGKEALIVAGLTRVVQSDGGGGSYSAQLQRESGWNPDSASLACAFEPTSPPSKPPFLTCKMG